MKNINIAPRDREILVLIEGKWRIAYWGTATHGGECWLKVSGGFYPSYNEPTHWEDLPSTKIESLVDKIKVLRQTNWPRGSITDCVGEFPNKEKAQAFIDKQETSITMGKETYYFNYRIIDKGR